MNELQLDSTKFDKVNDMRLAIAEFCENTLKQGVQLLAKYHSGGELHFYLRELAFFFSDCGCKLLYDIVSGETIELADACEFRRFMCLSALTSTHTFTVDEIANRAHVGRKQVERLLNGHYDQVARCTQIKIIDTLVQMTIERKQWREQLLTQLSPS
jgi:hypothetical protein